eukprot:TRINITY_DN1290_c0_g1_i16.p2 TRINITY_DN1290_c0_g1~~TRINITY_DN1290_c0_g1_i16.p2  ORF type:complete len:161 (+),score=34.09 TRINITY_DN1290_c0_g1_i16:352-834(+)
MTAKLKQMAGEDAQNKNKITALTTNVEKLNKEKEALNKSLADANTKLDQMKKEDTQNKDKVKTLTDKVAKLEVEKAALSKSIADLNSQIEELKPIQMKKQKKEEKKKEEQQTELPQDQNKAKIKSSYTEIEKLKGERESLNKSLGETKNALDQMKINARS